MPVHEQRYRSYSGEPRRHFRWIIVADQELRVLLKSRLFLVLFLVAMLQFLARYAQILAVDVILQDPNHPLTPILQNARFMRVDSQLFFDFVRLQIPITSIILLFAGSGMICNDVQNRLIEIYFAKPLKWWDYFIGKILALSSVGLLTTAIPSALLAITHAVLRPEWTHLRDSAIWGGQAIVFSLVIVFASVVFILAVSSLSANQRYSAIAAFMVPTINSGIGGILARLLRDPDYLIISSFVALDRTGHGIFGEEHRMFTLHWTYAAAYIFGFAFLMLLIFAWRCRRAEYAP